jgi:hypothetical protein
MSDLGGTLGALPVSRKAVAPALDCSALQVRWVAAPERTRQRTLPLCEAGDPSVSYGAIEPLGAGATESNRWDRFRELNCATLPLQTSAAAPTSWFTHEA